MRGLNVIIRVLAMCSLLFAAQIRRGQPAQFVIDQRHQLIERLLISVAPSQ